MQTYIPVYNLAISLSEILKINRVVKFCFLFLLIFSHNITKKPFAIDIYCQKENQFSINEVSQDISSIL